VKTIFLCDVWSCREWIKVTAHAIPMHRKPKLWRHNIRIFQTLIVRKAYIITISNIHSGGVFWSDKIHNVYVLLGKLYKSLGWFNLLKSHIKRGTWDMNEFGQRLPYNIIIGGNLGCVLYCPKSINMNGLHSYSVMSEVTTANRMQVSLELRTFLSVLTFLYLEWIPLIYTSVP